MHTLFLSNMIILDLALALHKDIRALCASLLFGEACLQLDDNDGVLTLAVVKVVYTNYADVLDVTARHDKSLEVDGEYLVAVKASDHSLDASDNEDEAVLIHITPVARMDPNLAVLVEAHYVCSLFGCIEVALHH